MKSHIPYAVLWFLIGVISSIDIYWSIINQEILVEIERNPIGIFLIRVHGDLALFMSLKVCGLVVVLGCLVVLYNKKRSWAWPVMVGVFLFQLWLLLYLNRGETKPKYYIESVQECRHTNINVMTVDQLLNKSAGSMKNPSHANAEVTN